MIPLALALLLLPGAIAYLALVAVGCRAIHDLVATRRMRR